MTDNPTVDFIVKRFLKIIGNRDLATPLDIAQAYGLNTDKPITANIEALHIPTARLNSRHYIARDVAIAFIRSTAYPPESQEISK